MLKKCSISKWGNIFAINDRYCKYYRYSKLNIEKNKNGHNTGFFTVLRKKICELFCKIILAIPLASY